MKIEVTEEEESGGFQYHGGQQFCMFLHADDRVSEAAMYPTSSLMFLLSNASQIIWIHSNVFVSEMECHL